MKLRNSLIYLIIFVFSSLIAFGSYPDGKGYKEVTELSIRGGVPNFFMKGLKGDSVKVAYLGGSITAQNGWRVYSLEWFKHRFPKASFTAINAAIGGTGSTFGVFRLNDQVMKFHPDLVFVEFAVNDGSAPSEKIIRSMEGIVRQIWQASPRTDICFIYTIAKNFLETELNGNLPASAETMEKVADKYNIPSINFGKEVCSLVHNKQLIFNGDAREINGIEVFSPHGVHPYPETGHMIYQNVLKRSFEDMMAKKPGHIKKHILHKPLAPDYFAHTQMIDFTNAKLSPKLEIISIKDSPEFSGFGRYLKEIGKAVPGETITVRFKGRAIGAYDIIGPNAGRVEVNIDGSVKDTINRFDAYCTYNRMSYFLIDHLENKNHVVIFRVLSEPFNKTQILAKRGNIIKNPDKYKEYNWYVGKIIVDGSILH